MNITVTLTIDELLERLQLDSFEPDEVLVRQDQDHDGNVHIELRNAQSE